ncbi:hypothetical protein M378DRAFT_28427 [Amanita muscaria Koide BX008]|uniref:Berberine/berberine-like domain-containing protein n=1 Tax=Amanita muscaria (strain Koide BX008) TaxID=946122 RepID=A0A0C2WHE5_AMAMK|nr:hypothetical protein M378DRAFT_28427 [Amanita muscaria Koide BX008]
MFILPALLAICIRVASKLSQPLVRPTPPAFACYPPSHPSGDCTDVLSHLDDGSWRDNLLGAMQSINFESFTFNNGTIDASYYNTTLGYPVTFRSSESTRRRLPIFSQSVPSFYDAYLAFFNVTGQVGGTNEFVSRLVSLEINRRKCPKWPWEFLTFRRWWCCFSGLDSAGLNPSWREALGLLVSDVTWNEGSIRSKCLIPSRRIQEHISTRRLYEKDFKTTLFGSHYGQLKSIKHKYDNDDLFLMAEGVGSDEWDKSLTCRI